MFPFIELSFFFYNLYTLSLLTHMCMWYGVIGACLKLSFSLGGLRGCATNKHVYHEKELPMNLIYIRNIPGVPTNGTGLENCSIPEHQRELIDILQQMKHKTLAANDGEYLFKEWQLKWFSQENKDSSKANKQKQVSNGLHVLLLCCIV